MVEDLEGLRAALADRYLLERELGSGGMANVYLATDVRHRRKVAVKVLRPDIGAVLGSARFLREIEIAAGLVHPHILGLHDSGEAAGLLYFVMPYVEGESLRARLNRERRLSLGDAVMVVTEVADALTHAHARGIVHRDVKPENILFEAGHAIVSDFGVARAVSAAGDTMTVTGLTVGTPAYMSPEQAVGERDVDGRSDVYSLGCVAYEMLSGERPFGSDRPQEVIARKLSSDAPGACSVAADLPSALEPVLAKAMARSPDNRYATPRDFAAALQGSLGLTWASNPRAAPAAVSVSRSAAVRRIVGASLVAVAVIVAVVVWPPGRSAAKPITAIAVLPFASPASDSTPAYFVEGIHDELIGELGRLNDLRVTSRHSVMSVNATKKTMKEIARELDVDALIEGAVYRIADSVRLQIRLVRAEPEERQLWSRAYDTHQRDLTALQERVARAIVQQIRTGSADDNAAMQAGTSLSPRRAVDAAAYDAYLRGKYWLNKRTPEGIRRADSAFRRAIALDRDFAAGHAGLATALALKVDWHYEPFDPISVSRQSIEAANRALALDPEAAEAYAARGRVLSSSHAPEDIVRRNFEKAIQLAPQYANAHGWYGMELSWRGKGDESRMANEKAIALEPLSPGRHMGYAFSAFNYGDYETALREARLALQLEPALASTVGLYENLALLFLGRPEKCDESGDSRYPSVRGICLHETGRAEEARHYIDTVAKRTSAAIAAGRPFADILAADNLTIYYAWTGNVDAALRWETEAMRLTTATTASLMIRTPLFDRVRRDKRWLQGYDALSSGMWQQLNTPPLRLEP